MCLCKVWLSPLNIFLLHSDLISEYVCFELQNHKKHCNGSIMTIHNQLKNIDFLFLYSNNKCLFSRKVMNNLNNPLAMPATFPTKFTSRFLHPSIFADRKTLYFSVDKIIQEFMSKKSRWQLIYFENSDRKKLYKTGRGVLERTYKPHYHYQNFSPLANGTDLNREKYAILQTHWH